MYTNLFCNRICINRVYYFIITILFNRIPTMFYMINTCKVYCFCDATAKKKIVKKNNCKLFTFKLYVDVVMIVLQFAFTIKAKTVN